jgi:hypothetical protein
MKREIAALLVLVVGASGAWAQCSRIKFARGRTTAIINGRAGAKKSACYKLHAREGQHMIVHLTSPDKKATFSIGPDEYDADFLSGASDVKDWEGDLSSASGNGDFLIFVGASKTGATFTLEVTIR